MRTAEPSISRKIVFFRRSRNWDNESPGAVSQWRSMMEITLLGSRDPSSKWTWEELLQEKDSRGAELWIAGLKKIREGSWVITVEEECIGYKLVSANILLHRVQESSRHSRFRSSQYQYLRISYNENPTLLASLVRRCHQGCYRRPPTMDIQPRQGSGTQ